MDTSHSTVGSEIRTARASGWLFDYAVDRLAEARRAPSSRCKICGAPAGLFDVLDFNKSCEGYPLGFNAIPVAYRRCVECHFIFTDFFDMFSGEQWQQYIYNSDYPKVDPEYLSVRPAANAREISDFLLGRRSGTIGLDFGGGNGMTTALLRQKGWLFDSYDPFGKTDISPERVGNYNFCSAFEVFEHTPDPVQSLQSIIEKTSPGKLIILITTGTHDGIVSEESRLSWSYAAPRNGHISLFSKRSLQTLGSKFGLTFSCLRNGPYLLTRGVPQSEAQILLARGKLLRRLRWTFRI